MIGHDGPGFPFSAVVGQDDLKLALLLNAIDRGIGGVLVRGQKGSGKSTLARGLAGLLAPGSAFVELPVGATEDRLIGTLDLAAALTGGGVRFQPGLLAAADGGVLYVDEVNLLPDHLVDALLDVAAAGVNRVEREGVSHVHRSRFVLIGSMNPEEGELRPQLLDRFGVAVDVVAPVDRASRAEAVSRRLAYDDDPAAFCASWEPAQATLRERLARASPAVVTPELVQTASSLCAELGAEGLRADLVICRAAAALAGWEGQAGTTIDDVRRVAPLALAHRRRRGPFDEPGLGPEEVDDALDRSRADAPEGVGSEGDEVGGVGGGVEGVAAGGAGVEGVGGVEAAQQPAVPDTPAPSAKVLRVEAPRAAGDGGGRRSVVEGRRGRLVGARVPASPAGRASPAGPVAVAATVRAAAVRTAAEGAPMEVIDADLRDAVREERAGNLVILAVDASSSMGTERRMEAAKGVVLSLLLDAYQRRDRVSLVTFRDDEARVVLRPTGSIEVARARLVELPTGGRTPLAAGIRQALALADAARSRPTHRPVIVLVSDGRATAAPPGTDPWSAAVAAAHAVGERRVPAVVVDVEDARDAARPVRLGLAAELARAMGARHVRLADLTAETLGGAVRGVIGGRADGG